MKRKLLVSIAVSVIAGGSLLLAVTLAGSAPETNSAPEPARQSGRTIRVTPWGPSQQAIDAAKAAAIAHPSVHRYIRGTRHRLLHFEFIEAAAKPIGRSEPPNRYRVTIFDYTNNRAIMAVGHFDDRKLEVMTDLAQPLPSEEEFDEAVGILRQDPEIGPRLIDKSLMPYNPMPPVASDGTSKSRPDRTVTVGLLPKEGGADHKIVGVNMVRQTVVTYAGGAPPTSSAAPLHCGASEATQPTTPRGTAGQFEVVISREGTELWRFIAIRPSISSCIEGSGIELRDVDYRGKRVLTRANVPVLNVQYERNTCGPFRDWTYRENMFVASGTEVAPGFLMSDTEPQTIIETESDVGTYRGVALYDREDVSLTSELSAAWYRYISLWIFKDEGIIQPRFGFSATNTACVCLFHTHHVYWRFDFDIGTAASNSIRETGPGMPVLMETEVMRQRQVASQQQTWLIENSITGDTVVLKPNPLDGNMDKFARGDVWLLRNKFPSEIDDSTQPGGGSAIRIDSMVNGESIFKEDVVIWYAGHWTHDSFDINSRYVGQGPFYNGPDIIIRRW
jgi:hypothetical protein